MARPSVTRVTIPRRNNPPLGRRFVCMTAYLWHVDGRVRHHIRAESVLEVRERIRQILGEENADRAVIKPLASRRDDKPKTQAA